jgi:hypothetical protein
MSEKEYYDSKGRSIRVEKIDGVTRQIFETKADPNEWEFGRQMSSQQDLQSCIRDPRWKTDPSFREAVIASAREASTQGVHLGNTGTFGVLEKAMAADNANSDDILLQREGVTNLFSDPRYKTSAAFRRYVMEQVALSDPRHEQTMPYMKYDAPCKETGQFAPAPKEEESPK